MLRISSRLILPIAGLFALAGAAVAASDNRPDWRSPALSTISDDAPMGVDFTITGPIGPARVASEPECSTARECVLRAAAMAGDNERPVRRRMHLTF